MSDGMGKWNRDMTKWNVSISPYGGCGVLCLMYNKIQKIRGSKGAEDDAIIGCTTCGSEL